MQLKSIQIKITLWVGFGLVLVGTGLIGASVFLSSNHKPEISSFVGKQAGLFLLLSGVALALVWSVSGGWLRSLIAATRFAEDLAQGLTPARLTTPARDEIGQLMQALNRLLEPANGLVPAEENQPATHESMPQLGAQVGLVTPGNLSGEIATNGAMNGTSEASLTMAELRGVISHVQERTEQLAKTSSATQNTTTSLVQEAELQADNVTQIVQAVAEMAQGIERVTENAALSASVAQQSWHTAKQGTEVVQSMLGGMSRLRAQVQQAARRLQYLGASSQEIGEIVQTLSDVSKRASYLALNAAIQAAFSAR
jgi:methyl-accepting chemotaxis protein